MVSLFPIKPVGCCNNAKCYVSLDEFKDLDERVTELEEEVSTMEEVSATVSGTGLVILNAVPGVYYVSDIVQASPMVRVTYTVYIDALTLSRKSNSAIAVYEDSNYAYQQTFVSATLSGADATLYQNKFTSASTVTGIGWTSPKVYRVKTS